MRRDTMRARHAPRVTLRRELPIAPAKLETPAGHTVIACPAETRENVTCASCRLCADPNRKVVIGFRAHGGKARVMSERLNSQNGA